MQIIAMWARGGCSLRQMSSTETKPKSSLGKLVLRVANREWGRKMLEHLTKQNQTISLLVKKQEEQE